MGKKMFESTLWAMAIGALGYLAFTMWDMHRHPVHRDPMRHSTTTGVPYRVPKAVRVPEDHDWTDYHVQCVVPKRPLEMGDPAPWVLEHGEDE